MPSGHRIVLVISALEGGDKRSPEQASMPSSFICKLWICYYFITFPPMSHPCVWWNDSASSSKVEERWSIFLTSTFGFFMHAHPHTCASTQTFAHNTCKHAYTHKWKKKRINWLVLTSQWVGFMVRLLSHLVCWKLGAASIVAPLSLFLHSALIPCSCLLPPPLPPLQTEQSVAMAVTQRASPGVLNRPLLLWLLQLLLMSCWPEQLVYTCPTSLLERATKGCGCWEL